MPLAKRLRSMGSTLPDVVNLRSPCTLKAESQGELLHTCQRQRVAVQAECRSVIGAHVQRSIRVGIEAHGICHVKQFPCEPEVHAFMEFPALCQAGVDAEVSLTTKIVAASRLSGIGVPRRCEESGNTGRRWQHAARNGGRVGEG